MVSQNANRDRLYRNVRVKDEMAAGGPVGSERMMHIGEVAERTSLSLRTLRHYDEIGLVVPSGRTEGGFRLYTESDIARLMLIRRMKPLGYSLEEMRDVLHAFDGAASGSGAADTGRLRAIRDAALERKQRLQEQVHMADEFLAQLDAL